MEAGVRGKPDPYKQVQIQFPLRSGRHSPNLLKRGWSTISGILGFLWLIK